jgi:D-tagatose-1,6-bisphosphate aldolase subunit GatZ/KbaZ
MSHLLDVVLSNRSGARAGICSICSANRYVLEAAMIDARERGGTVCIESTSNQVNQYGGYSGMQAGDFVAFVREIAGGAGLPVERVLLGGDHLGPNPWAHEPAQSAMKKACELVRSYVLAGYAKIHLDASMRCADDPDPEGGQLAAETVTRRAAELCRAAEEAQAEMPAGSTSPLYIIGTDVPPPGGEREESRIWTTSVEDLDRTVTLTREAFHDAGLHAAWNRVAAVVVQPGVEFGDSTVFDYVREKARPLSARIKEYDGLVFEAHSTDYQTPAALKQMVEDHFAILKVGPWLTFTVREAVFALESIEVEWLGHGKGVRLSGLREALERAMLAEPRHWIRYYRGDEAALRFARAYSLSDRSRYYWPHPEVQDSLRRLIANLSEHPVPLSLLSQFMPAQYEGVREGRLAAKPADLVRDRLAHVLSIYAEACGNPSGAAARGTS